VKTEEQKNVFAELQKNRKTRRRGLASPPKLSNEVANTCLPETPRRTYRVSTFISEDAGDILDELILKIKKAEGKKPKISRVLEMALSSLNSNFHT